MTNKKSTKRALLSSILSLVICLTMLIGTTFAWFTDNVTSANNIIKSGKLDVELYYQVEGQSDWTKVTQDTNVFMKDVLWEPGHTEVVKLKVVNEGNLALKYQLGVNVISETGSKNVNGEDFLLSEHIKFGIVEGGQTYNREEAVAAVDATATALKDAYKSDVTELLPKTDATPDNEDIVTMVVYMPTTVGNEANHAKDAAQPTINLGINLFASQFTYEEDSFNNQYDKDTEIVNTVGSAAQLANALAIGGKIVLEKDITISKEDLVNNPEVTTIPYGLAVLGKDVEIDLNGNDIEIEAQNGVALFVKDGSVTLSGEGKLSNTGTSGYVVWAKGASTVNVEGGEFFAGGDDTTLFYASGNVAYDPNSDWATINIYGGTFTNEAVGDSVQDYLNVMNHGVGRINIYGGTFDFDPQNTNWGDDAKYITVPKGYGTTDNDDGTYTVHKIMRADVNGAKYGSLEEAVAVAKAGDTITMLTDVKLSDVLTMPAGVILNGNGKAIDGTVCAGGDLTFAGHTKITSFNATWYNRTITIDKGACLEITGSGRVTLGYGNVFNITGSIANAKTADKANIQPSLIIPGGISITGGNGAKMNITDAYVQIGSTSSKNSAANGEFVLDITNSIAEFTNQLTFSAPTSGMNPTFKLNVKDSILTTATKLCIAAPNTTTVIDNSVVTLGSYLRNSGEMILKNSSVLSGAMIQFGENGGNDGTITVDASQFTITNSSTGHAMDGNNTGKLILKNGATASVDYIIETQVELGVGSTLASKSSGLSITTDNGATVKYENGVYCVE